MGRTGTRTGLALAAGLLIALLALLALAPQVQRAFRVLRGPPPFGVTGRIGAPQAASGLGPKSAGTPICYDSAGRPLVAATAGARCVSSLRRVIVSDVAGLRAALADARPGDAIELAPGDYDIDTTLSSRVSGSAGSPILVRGSGFGASRLHVRAVGGFWVVRPYWVFENLDIDGRCAADRDCEHAFHIVGRAHATIVRNNRLRNFNAAIKVNREGADTPDDVLIMRNLVANDRPRVTDGPVTAIDVVAVDRVRLTANIIMDFAKMGGDRTSYGAFAKGGGTGAIFDRNLVVCSWRHVGGWRVGLSMGGGGTGPGLCRNGQCEFEQRGGRIMHNEIRDCSDDGIYLRQAPESTVVDNRLARTAGIQRRFDTDGSRLSSNRID